jgi:hypothetical protein
MSSWQLKALIPINKYLAVVVSLTIYFALSITNLPPLVIIVPLLTAAFFMLFESDVHEEEVTRRQGFTSLVVVLLFLGSYLVSTMFSYNVPVSLNAIAVLLPGLLIAYIVAHIPSLYLPQISWCLSILVLAPSFVTIWMFLVSGHSDPGEVFREYRTPSLVVPNDMLLGVVFLPMAVVTFFSSERFFIRGLSLCAVAALAVALQLVESRLCFLTVVLLALLCLYYLRRNNFLLSCMLLLGSIFLADWALQLGVIENFLRLRVENARLSIWLAGLMRWTDHPIFGFGPGHFEIAYRLGISGLELPDWILVERRMIPWAHNIFIESLVERGLMGLVGQLALISLIFSRLWAHWKYATDELKPFYFGLLLSFYGFIIAGLFELTLQRIWVANSLFIFLGLAWATVEGKKGSRA